ncbi:MAG TPA: hypothetical protein VFM93_04745 [Candidatus Limnocylindria bacterium]|nr:hypothetical protein [Candidatus Limnocylindria bacterium]
MTAGATAPATIDVGHEAWARRWTYREDGRFTLEAAELVRPEDAARRDGGLAVGSGRAVRVALLVAGDDRAEAGARAALLAGGAQLVATLRAGDRGTLSERAAALRAARPDLALLLATDGRGAEGATDLAEALRAGCGRQQPAPGVLVAGEPRTTLRLHRVLDELAVEVLSDPRRDDGHAAIVGRCRELRRGADEGLVLRDEALAALARALARIAGAAAVAVDVTGDLTSVVRADPGGRVAAVHASGIGVGRGADLVVARAGLDRVRRWVPWPVDGPSLLERVFNRARWPDAVPAGVSALVLEIALAHEAIAHALETADAAGIPSAPFRDAPLVVLCGRPAILPRPAQTLLLALDAIVPATLCSVLRDGSDALVALGALSSRARDADPAAAIAVEVEARHKAIALVAPLDAPRPTVRIRTEAGAREERVPRGALTVIDAKGTVELEAAGAPLRGSGVAGPLGLVLDARRPLELPPRDAERVPLVRSWYDALGALPRMSP